MAKVHLVVGPVGAGKSTYALGLCRERGAVRLTLDEWMAALFRPDRPEAADELVAWYGERAQRCVEQIWRVTRGILASGVDVVLEIGLIVRHQREAFYWQAEREGVALTVHVLDAPREVRRERVERRNAERGPTFSMPVPMSVFELASDMWEPLAKAEIGERDIRFVTPA